ncbi:hypothetical protein DPMN_166144 [Dreissena polymorpha]|uniref:Uncharacterized protein n=1 Tax=Dreissena polymorpha TaxID=45954 RepID=A0A9D4ITW6_DREPO|nr:hypothetical protein DPMN_166144 [Dreissena polymorpha]
MVDANNKFTYIEVSGNDHPQTLRSTMKVISIVGWTRTGFMPFLSQTPYPMTIRMCLTSSSEMTPSHCVPPYLMKPYNTRKAHP